MQSTKAFGRGSEAITETKKKHIAKSAEYYISQNESGEKIYRFDVIEIYHDKVNNKIYINHTEDAFHAKKY